MSRRPLPLLGAVALALLVAASAESWLYEQCTTAGNVHVDKDAGGEQLVSLVLDKSSGAAFTSKQKYLYGEFSMQMRLIRHRHHLTSGDGPGHDEIDMEFLGNSSGAPVALSANVFANVEGNKEQQFFLWFDPAADYHTYTIIWNDRNIFFKVDDRFIRSFKRYADLPYPSGKPMAVRASLWDGSNWATRNGRVLVDWSFAPFTALYRGYAADACTPSGAGGPQSCPAGAEQWMTRQLSDAEWATVKWAKQNFTHYNYCDYSYRFPHGLPAECSRS